jgi:predicted SprT family Zn-dependent metalloprotease
MTVEKHLKSLLVKTCKEYDVKVPDLRLSKALKKANGVCKWQGGLYSEYKIANAKTPKEVESYITKCEIVISKHITEHYSLKTAEETLYHEIAHYLDLIFNRTFGHSNSFKEICVKLGGTMNSKLATGKFTEAASAEYVSNNIGYLYTCPCGKCKHETIRKVSEKMLNIYSCKHCGRFIRSFKLTVR